MKQREFETYMALCTLKRVTPSYEGLDIFKEKGAIVEYEVPTIVLNNVSYKEVLKKYGLKESKQHDPKKWEEIKRRMEEVQEEVNVG